MPDYPFKCQTCDMQQVLLFMTIAEYSEQVKDSQMTIYCDKCGHDTIFDRIIGPFQIMGGAKGYKSLEKYWEERPAERRQKEEQIKADMQKRHEAVMKKAATKKVVSKREDRHSGYKENKMRLDE